jgi:hypothetical protein
MILCKNGHPNEDGATYCQVCKVYIDSTQPVAPPPPPPAPPPPPTPPPPPEPVVTPVPPVVALAPNSVSIAQGGETDCEVRVQNQGQVADEYTLELAGQGTAFASLDPAQLSLQPGASGTARVTFHADASASPGPLPFQVVVRSTLLPDQPIFADGLLTIAAPAPAPAPVPAPPPSVELSPSTSEGRTSAEHVVTVTNPGGEQITATLTASDPDGSLWFDIEPQKLVVGPGEAQSARVRLRTRDRIFWSGERRRPFQLSAEVAGIPPLTIEGAFVQQRFVPVLLMPVASLFLLVLFAAVLLILVVIAVILYVVFH